MLAQTEIDVPARDLRMPFASFALVFTDRHVLSLGERLLSKRGGALAGNLLRVVTIFVTERHIDARRTLDLMFAFDALGDDLPDLVHHTLDVSDDAPVQRAFPQEDDSMLVEPHAVATTPLRELLGVAVNAILFATSSGVEIETRAAKATPRRSAKQSQAFTSESVYYLPGAIDITQVRRLKELARVGEGRDVLCRYLVRGHWRRAAKNWKDQRLRWIAPHWKGPDMAMVIERAYRLKP